MVFIQSFRLRTSTTINLNREIEKVDMTKRFSVIAGCLLGIVLPLLVVGIVSGTVCRHCIQLAPVVFVLIITIRRIGWSPYAALPLFSLWLVLMVLIWLYLLNIAKVISGHFTPVEIIMTIVIGLFCVWGIIASLRSTVKLRLLMKVLIFLLFLGVQLSALWMSFLKSLAYD